PALLAQQRAEGQVRVGPLRPQLDRPPVGVERIERIAAVAVGAAKIEVRLGELGAQLDGALQGIDRFHKAPALRSGRAVVEVLLCARSHYVCSTPSMQASASPPSQMSSASTRMETRPSRPSCIPWRAT